MLAHDRHHPGTARAEAAAPRYSSLPWKLTTHVQWRPPGVEVQTCRSRPESWGSLAAPGIGRRTRTAETARSSTWRLVAVEDMVRGLSTRRYLT